MYWFVLASLVAASIVGFARIASASDGSGVSSNGEPVVMAAALDSETKVDATLDGNEFDLKIDAKFESSKTDVHVLLMKVLKKLQLSPDEVAAALEVKNVGDIKENVDMAKMLNVKIDVDTAKGMSTAEATLELKGMAGSPEEAVAAISHELSALTVHDIHGALELTVK